MAFLELQKQAEVAVEALRPTVTTALEAAGFTVTEGPDWAKSLNVTWAADGTVATVSIRPDRRGGSTVVAVTVRPYFTTDGKAVTYSSGSKTDFQIDPAKIVARVKTLVTALHEKRAHEAKLKVWRAEDLARKEAWMQPVTDFMTAHGIEAGWESKCLVKKVAPGTLHLEGLTAEQMVAVLAAIK